MVGKFCWAGSFLHHAKSLNVLQNYSTPIALRRRISGGTEGVFLKLRLMLPPSAIINRATVFKRAPAKTRSLSSLPKSSWDEQF